MDSVRGAGRRGPKRWLGVGIRLLVTLFLLLLVLALNRCRVLSWPVDRSTVTAPALEAARARLQVEVRPAGAKVLVDGQRAGTTPVSLELPAGQHDVRVELDGYEPLAQTVNLVAGTGPTPVGVVVSGELVPVSSTAVTASKPTSAPAQDTIPPLPDLTVKYMRIELETGGDCDYASTQLGVRVVVENAGDADAGAFVVEVNGSQQSLDRGLAVGQTALLWFEGYSHGGENTVVVDATFQVGESNEDNNTLAQMVPIPTLPATCTPPPTDPPTSAPTPSASDTNAPAPLPTPHATVSVREGQVTIATYPYANSTTQARNEAFNMPYAVLDWAAYEATKPSPVDVTYRTLVLENEYLKLSFLPELGGRIYEVTFKPTGHCETYRNPVLKPSPWGPPEQGWWLAVGGIEWGLPVEEHGYEWGVPWMAEVSQDATGATVTLRDTLAGDRLRAEIAVRLEDATSYFTIRTRLDNPTTKPLAVKYWTNAMLAPGGRNAPSADLHFVLPDAVTAVTVHSRGDESLPDHNERLPWPIYDGVDLSRLGNWHRWLGFFEDPAVGGFFAVYDEGTDEGVVRVFPEATEVARGAKGFAFGWHDPVPASIWTDDGSSYVEIHGGPSSTFDDSVTLPATGHLEWTEIWYPVAGLGGLRYANDTAAFNLEAGGGEAQISVATTRSWTGEVVVLVDGQERWRQGVSLVPGQPFRRNIALGDDVPQTGRLALSLEAPDGTVEAEYSADYRLR